MNMAPWQLSPILFAAAKVIDFIADMAPFAGQPEQPLLHGVSAFLQVVTIYLVAKGIILATRIHKR
jgi:hypothetical protein